MSARYQCFLPFLKEPATNTVLHEKQTRTHSEKTAGTQIMVFERPPLRDPERLKHAVENNNNNDGRRSGQSQLLML